MGLLLKHWKIILTILIILLLGYFFWQKTNAENSSNNSNKYIKVRKGDLLRSISVSGKIKAEKIVDLKFQTSGMLSQIYVKKGDEVFPNQLLAQLDGQELQKNLEKSLRDYAKKRWDFEEDKNITYKNSLINDTIKRVLEKNQFDLEKAVLDVEISNLALKFSSLTTPIGGIITRLDVTLPGVNITPAGAVITVADPQSVYFEAEVDETDIKKIKLNQKTYIFLDAYQDEKIIGKINYLGFTSIPTSGGGDAYDLKITLPSNNKLKFKLGMNGDAEIIEFEKKNILLLPLSAIKNKNGQAYVLLKNGKNLSKQFISLGKKNEEEVEILNGLSENDIVQDSI